MLYRPHRTTRLRIAFYFAHVVCLAATVLVTWFALAALDSVRDYFRDGHAVEALQGVLTWVLDGA